MVSTRANRETARNSIALIFIISSLPLTPSGWGVGELLFIVFLNPAGVHPVQATALSLVFRFNATLLSLLGGFFLLLEKDRILPGEMEQDDPEMDEPTHTTDD